MKLCNTKPKLIVQLMGGLGNQMFQYATARSIAERNDMQLVLDTWSGFVRDFQYNRHYELGAFPINAREATQIERLPFWIDRFSSKLRKVTPREINKHWYGVFINETQNEFLPKIFEHQSEASCWMIGYWQSGKYFAEHESLIKQELSPPIPSDPHFFELGNRIRSVNSVALGLRLYEEIKNPAINVANPHIKLVESINQAISAMTDKQPSCHFFIFCTHRSPVLDQLDLKGDVTFVTGDDGYEGTLQTFWLLTQCRHHIITNSSYYWWGTWLSSNHYAPEEQVVFAANKFVNKDSILPQWNLF